MKKLLLGFVLMLLSIPVLSQVPSVRPSSLKPVDGFIRKGPCGSQDGYNCGSNPPTFNITPAMCGTAFSTSNARNADGSISTAGVRFNLPTVAQLNAAGYVGSGAGASSGFTNREGQCNISFIMGAPGPENYLRVGISGGLQGVDKFTPFAQGAYDFADGEISFPYISYATITFTWNGTSWLARAGSPSMMEALGLGQLASQGQGRLFVVSSTPAWWTAGNIAGNLAYCPVNGRGTIGNSNGGFQMSQTPVNCTFRTATAGIATEWIGFRNVTSGVVNSIGAGAAYDAGTAPNGEAYTAGNYAVLTVASAGSFVSGTTIEVHGVTTSLGTNVEGKWIGKLLTAGDPGCSVGPCIELHQRINESSYADTPVGPPSRFVAGDSMTAVNPVAFNYSILSAASISGARVTHPYTGADYVVSGSNKDPFVGIARRSGGVYLDSANNRMVASAFNPVERRCYTALTADRTVTSASFVEVNSEIRCNFVALNGTSARAAQYGDVGRGVRYSATLSAGNGTASSGCEFTVGFNGTTPEDSVGGFVNPSGVSGGRMPVQIGGVKHGLAETNHYATLLARAVNGGTCTVSAGSSLSLFVMQ